MHGCVRSGRGAGAGRAGRGVQGTVRRASVPSLPRAYLPSDENYQGLQQLYERYRSRGLEVLGFPSNQFGKQEPGSGADILAFTQSRFAATFPLMAKGEVNGAAQAPLYAWLKAHTPAGPGECDLWRRRHLRAHDGTC